MTELFHDLPGQSGQPSQTGAMHQEPKGRRSGRTLVVILLTLAVFVGAASAGYAFLKPLIAGMTQGDDYAGPGTGTAEIEIKQGESGAQIAAALVQAGVIKTAKPFTVAAAANPNSATIQPGVYRLKKQMKASDALAALLDPATRAVNKVTLPEGLRAADALARISKSTGLSVASLQATAKDPNVGLPATAKGNFEGYLFPATYDFSPGAKPGQVMRQVLTAYRQAMKSAGVPAAKELQVLTLASIVQGEAAHDSDMPKIARVFTNRLAKNLPFQSDVTVLFANNAEPSVTTTPAMRANPSPYNTYVHAGLPPGPINSPGLAAIKAALNPAPGPWIYFVAVNPDTGETRFATTPAEHAANVKLFQQWLAEHNKKTP